MDYPSTHKSLLVRIHDGDEVAWQEFYRRYSPVIRYVGALYRFNSAECDDLVQSVMLKFFNAEKKFVWDERRARFRTWFAAVIRSQAVEYIRANSRARRELPPVDAGSDPFADEFLDEWRKVMLAEALDALRLRVDAVTFQAFEMYALQHRDAAEVAEALGVTCDRLYVAKSRCLKMLKAIVAEYERIDGELRLEI